MHPKFGFVIAVLITLLSLLIFNGPVGPVIVLVLSLGWAIWYGKKYKNK